MRRNLLLLLLMLITVMPGNTEVNAVDPAGADDAARAAAKPVLSEADYYLDINTGKVFQVMYDGLNDKFERADLFAFDLYVNTSTKDTFWLAEALLVNNALVRDAAGRFKVNPMKVKRDGEGYKVINNTAVKVTAPASTEKAKEVPASAM